MTKKLFIPFILLTLFISCSTDKTINQIDSSFKFTTYEISFTDGWSTRVSFSVDTSKVFLASYKVDTLLYGILPDSLFEIINNNAFTLFHDKSIVSINKECYDCPSLSILVTFSKDTVRILQKGEVSDSIFSPITDIIYKFLRSTKNNSSKRIPFSQLLFETMQPIMPPHPEPINNSRQNNN